MYGNQGHESEMQTACKSASSLTHCRRSVLSEVEPTGGWRGTGGPCSFLLGLLLPHWLCLVRHGDTVLCCSFPSAEWGAVPELESLPHLFIPGGLAWFPGEPAKIHRKSLNFPESMKGRSERWPQTEGVTGMGLQAGNLKGKG